MHPNLSRGASGIVAPMDRLLDKISWDDLRAFQFVAEHTSLRAAAEAAGSHQGTMTRRIENLEKTFG